MTPGGIPIAGRTVRVPGLTTYNSADFDWCSLDPGDYRARRAKRPHLIIDHTTGGLPHQRVIPGAGPRGHAELIARMWSGRDRSDGNGEGKRVHSGAQILIDFDGSIWCLVDLVYCAAHHAEMANDASIGIEHCTTSDGSIYQATIDASVALHRALCEPAVLDNGLWIPFQVHSGPYRNAPLARCETGAKTAQHDGRVQSACSDLYGIIQHRDQTSERGWGDAGDPLRDALIAAGAEPLDYSKGQDLELGRARQVSLNAHGERLVVDSLIGAASLAAARRQGYRRWREVASS